MDRTDVMFWVLVIAGAALFVVAPMWREHARRRAEALRHVAEQIRLLRRLAGNLPRTEPAGPSTPIPAGLEPITHELEDAGFRRIGDLVEHLPDGRVVGLTRWVVSADGRVHGWAGITPQGPAATMLLTEDPATGFVSTMRGPDAPGVAVPANVTQQRVAWEEGLDAALALHRRAIQGLVNPVRVTDLDSAQGSLGRLFAQVRAWRSLQDPARLLEADVRKIAGPRFDDLGPTLIALVQALDDAEGTGASARARAD